MRLVILAAALACCAVPETGIAPPDAELYYPVGLAAHPDGRYLYVTNGVFDRKYNQGTLVVYDTHTRTLVPDATRRMGLFAGELVARRGGEDVELFTTSRDARTLYRFSARDEGRSVRLEAETDAFDVDTALSPDPYGIALHPDGGVSVTHVYRGVVSHWAVEEDGAWRFRCSANLDGGATGVARHPALGWLYVTDRAGNRVSMLEIVPSFQEFRGLATERDCQLVNRGTLLVDPSEARGRTRGLAFSADGRMLFVASSSDNSLRVYDTSIRGDGRPRNTLLRSIPVGAAPNIVRVAGLRADELARTPEGVERSALDTLGGGLVYVTTFDDDRVVVVDPQSLYVVARVDVGGGPHDLAFMADAAGKLRAYVTIFGEHSLSVIDIDPRSPERFRAIATVRP